MKSLEISAKTVEEAIQHALKQLGVSQEEVAITVVREGRPGILGLGAEEAVVRVTPLAPAPESDIVETAKDILERLLALMEVAGSVLPQAQPAVEGEKETIVPIAFEIKGDDLGILIGRRGQTLDCLQYLVRLIVGRQLKTQVNLVLDVEGYKQRRYQALEDLALRLAEQVVARRAPLTLRPMPPNERRIVHLTLASHPSVTTESIGEGETRRVVILPKEK